MPEEGIILKHLSLSRYIKRCCMSDNDAPYLSAHVYSDLGWLHPKGESIFSAFLVLSYTLWVYITCLCESDERGQCPSLGFSEAFVQILGLYCTMLHHPLQLTLSWINLYSAKRRLKHQHCPTMTRWLPWTNRFFWSVRDSPEMMHMWNWTLFWWFSN